MNIGNDQLLQYKNRRSVFAVARRNADFMYGSRRLNTNVISTDDKQAHRPDRWHERLTGLPSPQLQVLQIAKMHGLFAVSCPQSH